MAVGAGEEDEAVSLDTMYLCVRVEGVSGDDDGCLVGGTAARLGYASSMRAGEAVQCSESLGDEFLNNGQGRRDLVDMDLVKR